MNRDSTSDATLLNQLYTVMAVINQVNSSLMFIMTIGSVFLLSDTHFFIMIQFAFKGRSWIAKTHQ